MSKTRSAFFCQQCGYESAKWLGRCPSCGQWNSFQEEVLQKDSPGDSMEWKPEQKGRSRSIPLEEVESSEEPRIRSADEEFNRVLGGGIVPGSLVLVAGEPGIGKSTLMLQVALQLSGLRVLYVSGEESEYQVKLRADRLGLPSDAVYILTETDTQALFQEVRRLKPGLLIVDSVQTLRSPFAESAPGTVTQIRESTAELIRFAKATHTPVFLIGHITKDGSIAGPKVLEHMVDTVLQFEGDPHYLYRILRTLKNRFGSSSELGIYEMRGQGLRQVSNPSEVLISEREECLSGIAIASSLEGQRPLLVEIQALVSPSVYGTPQRTVNGLDLRRLQLLLAVLEKRAGLPFGTRDVFVNIAGGLRIEDPSVDLAILSALVSSYEDRPLRKGLCFAAEVGLSGEIRSVQRLEQRVAEAARLGFETICVSRYNTQGLDLKRFGIRVETLTRLEELSERLF